MSAFATYILEVDWDNDGDYSEAIEDITADSLQINTMRGRDYASMLKGRSVAASLRVTLLNLDGKYSPFNIESALFGLMLPGRAVRLRTTSPVSKTLFSGILYSLEPNVFSGAFNTAVLEAHGLISKLEAVKISPAAQSSQTTGYLMGVVLDAAGIAAGQQSLDTGITTVGKWFIENQKALDAVKDLEDTELGFLYEMADGTLRFEDRETRLTETRSTTSQAAYTDDVADDLHYSEIAEADSLQSIFNKVALEVQYYETQSLATLWTLEGTLPSIAAGQSRTFIATLSSTYAYVDAWTTPVVGTDITQTGVSNSDISVSVVKSAKRMEITITNNHASTAAQLTLVQARGTPVLALTPTIIQSEDSASITKYGERPYNIPAKWMQDVDEAQDYADFVISKYAEPTPVIEFEVNANKDSTVLTDILSREISDRITVGATINAKMGLYEDFYIENIRHEIAAGKYHKFRVSLSSTRDSEYWILGTSQLGIDTILHW